jgi:hypothetical protein
MERLEPGRSQVIFHSANGPLTVNRTGSDYVMDFPARLSEPVSPPPDLAAALGVVPSVIFAGRCQSEITGEGWALCLISLPSTSKPSLPAPLIKI